MDFYKEYERWINCGKLSEAELQELSAIRENKKEIESRFYGQLVFGTAGLRGVMGLGTNRMNQYVVRHSTQAFAQLILEEESVAKREIVIAYDCRLNSDVFAKEAACVMAANGIHVLLFDALRPTPELSFAIREYGCIAGINITASHNTKEYNGYKVYWRDGAQLPPQHAAAIANKMAAMDVFDSVKTMPYEAACEQGLITLIGYETDERFLKNVLSQANDKAAVAKVSERFKMVYTPFHGAGYRLVPEALHRLGMQYVLCVPEQMVIDGNFPTVVSPNPENPDGFQLAISLAEKNGADFILGTDPDADRTGIMVRDSKGQYVTITGNQTGALLLDYLIGAKKRNKTMPQKPVMLKSIVTTDLARKIAEENGVACFDTFTGFKFMAEKMNALEAAGEGTVIFSYEESYGFMAGDYVRDKDAITTSVLLTEMAAWYACKNMTLYDALQKMFEKYGYYREKTLNLVMPGIDGLETMKKLMENLRTAPLNEIAGTSVMYRRDYQSGVETNVAIGKSYEIELSGSNVLSYGMMDETTIIVRPSGTEPKIKVYILTKGESFSDCDQKIDAYSAWAETLKK